MKYTFINPNGLVLFEGDDFCTSPLYDDSEGNESAKCLLSFLTLQLGDTDEEYFEHYTEAQMEFRDSFDCMYLQLHTLDE